MAVRRPRLKEISQKAGVSKATVDRVINNRSGVQEHTRRHVLSVAAELAGESPGHAAQAGRRIGIPRRAQEEA